MNIHIDQEAKIVIIDLERADSTDDIRLADETLLSLNKKEGPFDAIYDCSRSDFKRFRREALTEHALWLSSNLKHFPKHVALVAEKDLEYGICRMWEMQAETIAPIERSVFRHMDEAKQWLLSLRPALPRVQSA